VVPLAELREARKDARRLAAECPGWRCWYSLRAGLWFGKRIVERWLPERTGRSYIVLAVDAATLQAIITTQAVLDLAMEFGDWEIECMPGGQWRATWDGAGGGGTRPIFCEISVVKLAASLREYLADIDEPEDPRLVWLCDSDDQ
jgi:hypothetical protein